MPGAATRANVLRIIGQLADLVERERKIVLPAGGGEDETESAPLIANAARIERTPAEAAQEILDLIDGLDCRGRIVDGRGKGLDGDVHQEPQGVFGILFGKCALSPSRSIRLTLL
jgi:hypothetical protein